MSERRSSIKATLASWETLLVILLAGVIIFGSSLTSVFFEGSNFSIIASTAIERATMALPMTLIIIGGEIDLSVASMAGLASVVVGDRWDAGWPLWLCIAAALAVGVTGGLLNGLLITQFRLPSLVVTLGTLALYRGLAYVIMGDRAISDYPSWFTTLGFRTIPETRLPWSLVIYVPLLIVFLIVLHRSWIGRQLYAVGLNAEAARYSAIRVARIKLALYVVSGLMAALAGIIYTARVSSSRADNAIGYELDVIAAVLLGGVSIFGGRGTLLGVVLSLAVIATLRNALALDNVNADIQSIAVGGLLILSVLGPNVVRRLSRRSRQVPARQVSNRVDPVDSTV